MNINLNSIKVKWNKKIKYKKILYKLNVLNVLF
jgi:hypothetical protein